ncbi:hypothetical protein HPB49_026582 [Dermacentor silvarum]|nr:hypothetical protein HPB49_026582 [Dermacentor silvarum]
MADIRLPQVWIGLLHRLYKDNTVVARFGGAQSQPVVVMRGLKQGFPMSPMLYMLYVSGLERAFKAAGVGFSFRHMYEGTLVTWKLPGLVYADDIVLLAESPNSWSHSLRPAYTNVYLPGGELIQ